MEDDFEMTDETIRGALLDEAKSLIEGDRNNQYGPPHSDFARTAAILTAMGFTHVKADDTVDDIQAHHVAMILAVVKLSRLTWSPEKRDSWLDLAGYAGCGHEAYVRTRKDESDWKDANPSSAIDWETVKITVEEHPTFDGGKATLISARPKVKDEEKYPHRHQMGHTKK